MFDFVCYQRFNRNWYLQSILRKSILLQILLPIVLSTTPTKVAERKSIIYLCVCNRKSTFKKGTRLFGVKTAQSFSCGRQRKKVFFYIFVYLLFVIFVNLDRAELTKLRTLRNYSSVNNFAAHLIVDAFWPECNWIVFASFLLERNRKPYFCYFSKLYAITNELTFPSDFR